MRELEEANTQHPGIPTLMGALGYALERAGRRDEAAETARLIERLGDRPGRHTGLAKVALGPGDVDGALQQLEEARAGEEGLYSSEPLMSPMFDLLRTSPRFRVIVSAVGLNAERIAVAGR